MNGRMIGVIGGTGRVGRECLRYLHENTAFGLLIGGRKPPREALPGSFLSVDVFDEASLARFCGQCFLVINWRRARFRRPGAGGRRCTGRRLPLR